MEIKDLIVFFFPPIAKMRLEPLVWYISCLAQLIWNLTNE